MSGFTSWFFGDPAQRTQSFLRAQEQRLIQRLILRAPDHIEPAQLSGLGALGAIVAAAALIAAHSWPAAIWIIPPAIAVNWYGLSLDLPLARSRGHEAAADGMAHHLCEIFSQLAVLLAYGFSPFLTLRSATIVLVCYLLFSAYAYIRAATRHVEQMAYIGIGVTEFRILLMLWPFAAILLGVPESLGDRLPAIDVAIMSLAGLTMAGLIAKLFLDSRKITAASGPEE
ncbi:hypothetical protein [Methylocystis parvus]|uniref:Uncharacterized protein n=1 Tax=Methylocystis parvus TaxID=134 RepID=A0A6B8M6Z5_9HYPH|nr:hypothetical protein [Methylocystis parvus]QGM96590.1 hypothetical protein F7D14_03215 [Methylocystis parvus]WBJ99555.1 hypothetical protein MMG94_16415 [Methylocystis parvus OBBP]